MERCGIANLQAELSNDIGWGLARGRSPYDNLEIGGGCLALQLIANF